MKITKWMTVVMALAPAGALAGGGSMGGNGGDAVVCRDANDRILSVELLDFYENRTLRGMTPDLFSVGASWEENVEAFLASLDRLSPERATRFRAQWKTFLDDTRMLRKHELKDIPDSDHLSFPQGCKVEQLVIQQPRTFPEDPLYLLNADLWDELDSVSRAGMVLHEFLYREVLDRYRKAVEKDICREIVLPGEGTVRSDPCGGPVNSVGVRYLTGIFTSRATLTQSEQYVLEAQSRVPFFGPIEIPRLSLSVFPPVSKAKPGLFSFVEGKLSEIHSLWDQSDLRVEANYRIRYQKRIGDADLEILIGMSHCLSCGGDLVLKGDVLQVLENGDLGQVLKMPFARSGSYGAILTSVSVHWPDGSVESIEGVRSLFDRIPALMESGCVLLADKELACSGLFSLDRAIAWGGALGEFLNPGVYSELRYSPGKKRLIEVTHEDGTRLDFVSGTVPPLSCDYRENGTGLFTLKAANAKWSISFEGAGEWNPWLREECGVQTWRAAAGVMSVTSREWVKLWMKDVVVHRRGEEWELVSFRTSHPLYLLSKRNCGRKKCVVKRFEAGDRVLASDLLRGLWVWNEF